MGQKERNKERKKEKKQACKQERKKERKLATKKCQQLFGNLPFFQAKNRHDSYFTWK